MRESLLCKLQWKVEYRSVYRIHVRASEKPCFRSQVLGRRDGLLHFVWSLLLWVPWVSPEPSCGCCTIITSIDDTDIAQSHLPFVEIRKTTLKLPRLILLQSMLSDTVAQRKVTAKL